ncbi:HisA/HisF family protein [Methanocaldococcus indicus]|uniref:HisA/HisF family protein n=1 Tax=Methanocaldococcus indicus TaxID=213231 RepID=UPI003C6D7079
MEIIPVLDIKNGIAVSGKSGDRENYKPLKSVLVNSSNPIEIVDKYKEELANTVYIADLDAIERKGNNLDIIVNLDINKIVDCGIRKREDYEKVKDLFTPILGLETLRDLTLLKEKDIIVSLDFKNGKLLNYDLDFILSIVNKNVPLIILDISAVGTKRGLNLPLIKEVLDKTNNPIYVGGGIKDLEDLEKCYNLGIDGVLIGTAIHNGTLRLKEIIERFR